MMITILSRLAMMIGIATVATKIAEKRKMKNLRLVPVRNKIK